LVIFPFIGNFSFFLFGDTWGFTREIKLIKQYKSRVYDDHAIGLFVVIDFGTFSKKSGFKKSIKIKRFSIFQCTYKILSVYVCFRFFILHRLFRTSVNFFRFEPNFSFQVESFRVSWKTVVQPLTLIVDREDYMGPKSILLSNPPCLSVNLKWRTAFAIGFRLSIFGCHTYS